MYSSRNHPSSPNFAEIRPGIAQNPNSATQLRPKLGPSSNFGPTSARNQPELAKVRPDSAELGPRISAKCGLCSTNPGPIRPKLAGFRSSVARHQPASGRFRLESTELFRFRPILSRFRPTLARNLPTLSGFGPNWVRIRPQVTRSSGTAKFGLFSANLGQIWTTRGGGTIMVSEH